MKTDTYVIRRFDEPAYQVFGHGRFERDSEGKLVPYSKDDVVDVVSHLINNKELKKGDKITRDSDNYITYRFVYKKEKQDGSVTKYAYRVRVSKAYIDDNETYVNRLDALVKASHAIKKVNKAKMIAIGLATTLTLTGFTFAMLNEASKEAKIADENNKNYVEQINSERRDNNLPPLGAAYEDGTSFVGSYVDWVKYISGYTDKDGNVISDESAKTYQKAN